MTPTGARCGALTWPWRTAEPGGPGQPGPEGSGFRQTVAARQPLPPGLGPPSQGRLSSAC